MDSRTLTALAGLAISLAVSVVAWVLFDSLLLLLFVPFVPFLFRRGNGSDGASARSEHQRPSARTCPVCSYRSRDPREEYCPRDGHRLEVE
jgi:hypothetical protein